jgi:crotonobetainyl-CoA:carnitine CoA-transferase CaiB-like acyl-CoA transferase
VTVTRAGFKLSSGDPAVAAPPPQLGQHTDELLHGLGYSGAEIAELRSVGAI